MTDEVAYSPITSERYISQDYMLQERDKIWARTWLVAGVLQDVEEPGDFLYLTWNRNPSLSPVQRTGNCTPSLMSASTVGQRSC